MPGIGLDELNLRMGRQAIIEVDKLVAVGQQRELGSIMLLDWVRRTAVRASGCGVFGEKHPFRDLKVEKAFWYIS
jgi:hypothetical protein